MNKLVENCLSASEKDDLSFFEKNINDIANNIQDLINDDNFFKMKFKFLHYIAANVDFSSIKNGFDVLKQYVQTVISKTKNEGDLFLLFTALQIKESKNFSSDQYTELLLCFNQSKFFKNASSSLLRTIEELKNQISEKDKQIGQLTEIARKLREENNQLKGIKPIDTSDTGEFDIFKSAENGKLSFIQELVEKYNANVNATNANKEAPLHLAALNNHIDVVKYLCERKANVELQDKNGYTPLHSACKKGNLEIVQYLVEEGKANRNARTLEEKNPLHVAAQFGRKNIIEYLTSFSDINIEATDCLKRTPFYIATQFDHLETAKYLKEKGAKVLTTNMYNNTPIHVACMNGFIDIVKYFLEDLKCDPYLKGNHGSTLLHYAARNNHCELTKYLIEKHHFDVNIVNEFDETPLHFACMFDCYQVVQLLIEKHANKDIADKDGKIPFHVACENGSINCLKMLSGDPLSPNGIPIFSPNDKNNIMVTNYLNSQGLFTDKKDEDGNSAIHIATRKAFLITVQYLIENLNFDINLKGFLDRTPLHYACLYGHHNIVEYLISKGANIEAKEINGKTPLHYACENGYLRLVKTLVPKGANIEATSNDGYTPLHLASLNGENRIVSYLLSKGANKNIKGNDGKTPLDLARNDEIRSMLKYEGTI